MEEVSLSAVTVDDFIPHVSSTFTLIAEDEQLPLTLEEAIAVRGGNPKKREPFSLVFSGTPGHVLPQKTYRIVHPSMGAMEIFIVPIAASADGTQYEAIFA